MSFIKFLRIFTGVLVLLLISGCYSIVAKKEFKAKLKTCYSHNLNLTENKILDLNGYYLMYVKGDFSFGPPNTPYYET